MWKVSLKVVGNPAPGSWGMEGFPADPRNVIVTVRLDGLVHHDEHTAPYGFLSQTARRRYPAWART